MAIRVLSAGPVLLVAMLGEEGMAIALLLEAGEEVPEGS
jgi:hypothetical protein